MGPLEPMVAGVGVLAAAALVDGLLGEPPNPIHPVVWMGRVTRFVLRAAPSGPRGQLLFGTAVALLIPGAFAGASWGLLEALAPWPWLAAAVAVYLTKSTFALRALGQAAQQVRRALHTDNVDAARHALGSLCSRDASQLDPPLLVAATVESVAENASDSVVAPLLFFALGGVPGAMFYRTVNTLDAMIGYRGRYEYLGKAAARLDDLLNLVPARLTALLLLAAGALCRRDVRQGWRIMRRDAGKTASPNAGHPMAAMAGLLHIELVKRGHYRLGDSLAPLRLETIDAAWSVVRLAAWMGMMGTVTWTWGWL